MITIFVTAALLFILLVAAYRTLLLAGVPHTFKTSALNRYFRGPASDVGESPSRSEYMRLAIAALLLRIGLYVFSALFMCFFSNSGDTFSFQSFLEHWHRWDASNYIRIATGGYSYHLENGVPTTLVFFPLYSVLIKGVYYVVRDYDISALLVSTLSYIAGSCYLFGFVSEEYGKRIGYKAFLYLSIFPFSFFFGAMMPESVFLFTSCAFFYYMRRHNWIMVAVFGYLSALSRIQGILLLIPAGIEWLSVYQPVKQLMERRIRDFFKSLLLLLPICSGLLGVITYLLINYQVTGNCFKFLELQESVWHHHYEYVGKAIETIVHYTVGGSYDAKMVCILWIPQAVLSIGTLVLLIYAANKHKPQYILYLTAYTVVSFSASFILSGGRYMSVAVPIFFLLAKMFDKKRSLHIAFVIGSSMLLAIYMAGYVLGYQIM